MLLIHAVSHFGLHCFHTFFFFFNIEDSNNQFHLIRFSSKTQNIMKCSLMYNALHISCHPEPIINLRDLRSILDHPQITRRSPPKSNQTTTSIIEGAYEIDFIKRPSLEKDSISIIIARLKESLQVKLTKSSKLSQNIEQ
jgi:hypothetical protein